MKSSQPEWIANCGITKQDTERIARRVLLLAIILLGLAIAPGCSPFRGLRQNLAYNDSMNDFVMGWRNSAWARQAWNERKGMYVNEPQFVSFGQGFRDGYADVAGGANGCVPPLPPRSFWTWKYQTGEGQAKVAAWFAGYPHGAKAAQEDGAGNFQQIQVSHLIEAQYSPEFQAGKCPGCDPSTMPNSPVPGPLPGMPGEIVPAPHPQSPQPPMADPPLTNPPLTNPLSDPTTHSNSQAMRNSTWSANAMTRIPQTMTPHSSEPTGMVVPASFEMPVR